MSFESIILNQFKILKPECKILENIFVNNNKYKTYNKFLLFAYSEIVKNNCDFVYKIINDIIKEFGVNSKDMDIFCKAAIIHDNLNVFIYILSHNYDINKYSDNKKIF